MLLLMFVVIVVFCQHIVCVSLSPSRCKVLWQRRQEAGTRGSGIGGTGVPHRRTTDKIHSCCVTNDHQKRVSERLGRPRVRARSSRTTNERASRGRKNASDFRSFCSEEEDHTSSYAQNAWHRRMFFSCTRDQPTCSGSRPSGQLHVDCLSPRAHQKPVTRLMFRGTLLESPFSSPSPFSSFCSTPLSKTMHYSARRSHL